MTSSENFVRQRAALFIDFDNVFSSLFDQDRDAAKEFGTDPARWLRWLASQAPAERPVVREFLVRRCYLNPKHYGYYRPFFVRAGFEVVDCPALTNRAKNGADIRMVIDMLDALSHPTRFEEFVLLSGDADFTPLLLRLRAHDRRTLVLAAGYQTASAYAAACDQLVDPDAFLRALGPPTPVRPEAVPASVPDVPAPAVLSGNPAPSAGEAPIAGELARFVRDLLSTCPGPIALSVLSAKIQQRFGPSLRGSGWLGEQTFKGLLRTLEIGQLQMAEVGPGYLFDPARHQQPAGPENALLEGFRTGHPAAFELAVKVNRLTPVPLFTPEQYRVLFEETAAEVNDHGFERSRTVRAVRDRCTGRLAGIGRIAVNSVLRGLTLSGHPLGGEGQPPENAAQLGRVFVNNVLTLCEAAQFDLGPEDVFLLETWFSAEPVPPSADPTV